MFGKRLKELRKAKKITQLQLAKTLGTTKTTVSGWENGYNLPSSKTLFELCKVLDVSCDYLIGLSNEQKINVEGLNEEAIDILRALADYFRKMNEHKDAA